MKIGKDKVGHFKAGMLIAIVVSFIFDVGWAIAAVLTVGASKEIYDYFHQENHTPEFLDFWFTALGGFIVVMLYSLF